MNVCRSMKDALAIYGEWQLRTLQNHRRSVGKEGAGLRFLVVTPGPEGWGNRALVLGSALLMAMQVCVCVRVFAALSLPPSLAPSLSRTRMHAHIDAQRHRHTD